ncbi:MAG TPA: hypothetical protein VFQ21_01845 [Gemmatimonadota bacterium]|nr:hypothetical protein [Gemmatimonadota bacterium]
MRARFGWNAMLALLLAGSLASLGCDREEPAAEQAEETDIAVEEPALDVTNVALGRSIGADRKVVEEIGNFAPGDTIYASVETEGAGSGTLAARWTFEDGQVVDESSHPIGGGAQVSEFHVSKPDGWPAGHYEVVILLNGQEADRKGFDVEAGT